MTLLHLFDNAACLDLQIPVKDSVGYLTKTFLQARSRRYCCKKVWFESNVADLKCARDLHCHSGCQINFKNGSYRSVEQTSMREEQLMSPKNVCAGGYLSGKGTQPLILYLLLLLCCLLLQNINFLTGLKQKTAWVEKRFKSFGLTLSPQSGISVALCGIHIAPYVAQSSFYNTRHF